MYMYILPLLLLMANPLVMSNSPFMDVSMDMDSLVQFNEKTPILFSTFKNIFEAVNNFLEEAEKNILDMRSEIDNIKYEKLNGEDISKYHRVKSSLEKVRQDLIKLAHKTVTDVRDLKDILDELDESNDPVLLRLSIENMKDLMDETKKTLEAAKAQYDDAVDTFQSFMSSIQQTNRGLDRNVHLKVRDHDGWKTKVRTGELAAFLGAGFFAGPLWGAASLALSAFWIEPKIGDYDDELERFKSKAYGIMWRSKEIERDIKVGIELITQEIYLIDKGS